MGHTIKVQIANYSAPGSNITLTYVGSSFSQGTGVDGQSGQFSDGVLPATTIAPGAGDNLRGSVSVFSVENLAGSLDGVSGYVIYQESKGDNFLVMAFSNPESGKNKISGGVLPENDPTKAYDVWMNLESLYGWREQKDFSNKDFPNIKLQAYTDDSNSSDAIFTVTIE